MRCFDGLADLLSGGDAERLEVVFGAFDGVDGEAAARQGGVERVLVALKDNIATAWQNHTQFPQGVRRGDYWRRGVCVAVSEVGCFDDATSPDDGLDRHALDVASAALTYPGESALPTDQQLLVNPAPFLSPDQKKTAAVAKEAAVEARDAAREERAVARRAPSWRRSGTCGPMRAQIAWRNSRAPRGCGPTASGAVVLLRRDGPSGDFAHDATTIDALLAKSDGDLADALEARAELGLDLVTATFAEGALGFTCEEQLDAAAHRRYSANSRGPFLRFRGTSCAAAETRMLNIWKKTKKEARDAAQNSAARDVARAARAAGVAAVDDDEVPSSDDDAGDPMEMDAHDGDANADGGADGGADAANDDPTDGYMAHPREAPPTRSRRRVRFDPAPALARRRRRLRPKPKDWANKKINRKEAELAIGIAIQNKAARATVVDSLAGKFVGAPKTKSVTSMLSGLGLGADEKAVLVYDTEDDVLEKSAANLPNCELRLQDEITVSDMLWANQVLFTKPAFDWVGMARAPRRPRPRSERRDDGATAATGPSRAE
ncbi:ribosomal protein L14 [Aureococcus anophagefferens]|uniref:Large ribosomal subunit protein uL4c n=1 Tax=Aureococcus anophagefferens TaxID=44056 RepID=A0ABR1G3L7_AURAN